MLKFDKPVSTHYINYKPINNGEKKHVRTRNAHESSG